MTRVNALSVPDAFVPAKTFKARLRSIEGRGFQSRVKTGADQFFDSDCVSCGACVQACPTATLMENTVIEQGVPDRSVLTTCAYCGVGCSFKAEVRDQVVRMVRTKTG